MNFINSQRPFGLLSSGSLHRVFSSSVECAPWVRSSSRTRWGQGSVVNAAPPCVCSWVPTLVTFLKKKNSLIIYVYKISFLIYIFRRTLQYLGRVRIPSEVKCNKKKIWRTISRSVALESSTEFSLIWLIFFVFFIARLLAHFSSVFLYGLFSKEVGEVYYLWEELFSSFQWPNKVSSV